MKKSKKTSHLNNHIFLFGSIFKGDPNIENIETRTIPLFQNK